MQRHWMISILHTQAPGRSRVAFSAWLTLALIVGVSAVAQQVWAGGDLTEAKVMIIQPPLPTNQVPCAPELHCQDKDCSRSFAAEVSSLPYVVSVDSSIEDLTTEITFKVWCCSDVLCNDVFVWPHMLDKTQTNHHRCAPRHVRLTLRAAKHSSRSLCVWNPPLLTTYNKSGMLCCMCVYHCIQPCLE